jgi:N-acylneuraminate cytidylyltransferase
LNVAVIPARGGSKRIPRKNVRTFAGKPMIGHAITVARESGMFSRVIVSTDDAEIAAVARSFGAQAPFMRPETLADDCTGTTEVVAHAVQWLRSEGEDPTAICCLYATAAFVRVEDLARGLALLNHGGWQYVFSATTFAAPVQRAFHRDARGGIEVLFPEHARTRSQDLREALHDAGQFYWARPEVWLACAPIFDAQSTVIQIPRWRVQDIDTEEDWTRAESMAAHLGLGVA